MTGFLEHLGATIRDPVKYLVVSGLTQLVLLASDSQRPERNPLVGNRVGLAELRSRRRLRRLEPGRRDRLPGAWCETGRDPTCDIGVVLHPLLVLEHH